MPYCPSCGKRSEDHYAKVCGHCSSDMKSLGEAKSTKVDKPKYSPMVFAPKPIPASKPIRTASEMRNRNKPVLTEAEDYDPSDDSGNGPDYFNPDILEGEIHIESDEEGTGIPGTTVEKMNFKFV